MITPRAPRAQKSTVEPQTSAILIYRPLAEQRSRGVVSCRGHRVVAFLLSMGASRGEAWHAAQEAMLIAFQSWASILQPSAYVRKVAVRIMLHAVRHERSPLLAFDEIGSRYAAPRNETLIVEDVLVTRD